MDNFFGPFSVNFIKCTKQLAQDQDTSGTIQKVEATLHNQVVYYYYYYCTGQTAPAGDYRVDPNNYNSIFTINLATVTQCS